MRNVFVVVTLAAGLAFSFTSPGVAASSKGKAQASYRTTDVSQTAGYVPPNCIRQSCGKLWCWQMRGEK